MKDWIVSDTTSIIKLGIKLTMFYNYTNENENLVKLLKKDDKTVRHEVVMAINFLFIIEAETELIQQFSQEDTYNKLETFNTLSKTRRNNLELVTRMTKCMYDNKLPFSIQYIPESLCWTEVPTTKEVFISQRVLWARGLVQKLYLHKNVFFNPKYQRTGFLIFPYFLFFEFLIPILEVNGVIVLILNFVFLREDYFNFLYLTKTINLFYIIVTFISILLVM